MSSGPVEQIYADAWKKIRDNSWLDAAKQFDEVERQHPYSVWARRAMLMSAYCYYQANHYTDAINTAEQIHPAASGQQGSGLCLLSEGDVAL